jgi:hypothetical protein
MPKGGIRPQATCHPDRPHWAKGLCSSCYEKRWFEVPAHQATKKIYRKKYHRDTDHGRRHSFTLEDEIRFNAITICDWCGHSLQGETPHIDHDHRCCNNAEKHCAKCTRGFVHPQCNTWAINYFEWQERVFGITDPRLADYRHRFPVPRIAGPKDL